MKSTKLEEQHLLKLFLNLVSFRKLYLVKMYPIFDSSPPVFGARYQSFIRVCWFLHKEVLYFGCPSEHLNNPTDIIVHVREHLEDEVKLRPEAPRGLGCISTQTDESMHHVFDKFLERLNPHWNCPELLIDELCRAMASWAAKCLWPVAAEGDIE